VLEKEQMMSHMDSPQVSAAQRLIAHLLSSLLDASDRAGRVCFGLIADVEPGRYRVIDSVARWGGQVTPPAGDRPLLEWSEFLPALSDGLCAVLPLPTADTRACFESFGATSMLVCPGLDPEGTLAGALFILWDSDEPMPSGDAVPLLMATGQRVAGQIAAIKALVGLA
jgi:hypothetical protein